MSYSLIQHILDYFNKTNDWSVLEMVPEDRHVDVMYPHYAFGYRAEEVAKATDPRIIEGSK